ncbi:MAG: 6-pyruvoyl-tetrahydropterin synthase-related protein [Syntrophales bacterium]|nr:6-pyruvoyl-tetrahydropterin synthase-related protein [Syntrophales bacterium]
MKRPLLIDVLVLTGIIAFLLLYFEPRYLLSSTTITGGDTASHYATAVYLKETLLPKGRVMGWHMGNYAGFPLFYHYFPLPFLLAALSAYLVPLPVTFKIVTVLGVFLLPLCIYGALAALRYPFPIPSLGAAFSLPFLFMEANSMWGANIPSTLAGEFAYGIGVALVVLFFGTLYRGIDTDRLKIVNALLVCLIGLSHGYALIFTAVCGAFFLLPLRGLWPRFLYLAKIYGLGSLLMAFWLLPFVETLPWTTGYATRWAIAHWSEVIPLILIPLAVLAVMALFLNLFDRRTLYFLHGFLCCLILYFIGPSLGILDIRFIPILQLLTVMFAATAPLTYLGRMKAGELLALIALVASVLWSAGNATYIRQWIAWNYEGFEGKRAWPLFAEINTYLREAPIPGRIVYEHSPNHNIFGSERAFESLPYFAGRPTLEGLYMQSSISSPFVFYIQSEVSQLCSGPFPQYTYASLDLRAALAHLKMFNVSHYLARSEAAKAQAGNTKELKQERRWGDYELYRITTNTDRYVVPLTMQPVRLRTEDWKRSFFAWFRQPDLLEIPLVFLRDAAPEDLRLLPLEAADLRDLPRRPLTVMTSEITERIEWDKVVFRTPLLGHPHLVRVSYHPAWRVEGAEKIYLAAPSFMLVYPREHEVRLYFAKTAFDRAGEAMTWLGFSILVVSAIIAWKNERKP